MAETGFGKKIEETFSSSSSVPLITHRRQLVTQKNLKTAAQASTSKALTSTEGAVPKKAINILRLEHPENRRKARTKLLEILIEKPNPDAGKTIVVDIDSEDEFDEALNELKRDELRLKKRIWLKKVNDYSR